MKKTGDEYFDNEEFRELLDNYEESVKSGHPLFMDADDLADIADYYHFTGMDQQAGETIEYALSLYPNATLPNVFKAREALTSGDVDTARECVEMIENKDDPEYHYMQAELLMAQDKVEEADDYLRQYFKTVPPDEYQDFVMDVANIYFDYGLNEKAYEWMMRSKGDGSNDFKELMARTLFGLGKYKDSERIFNELLDKNPYSKRYWNALANAQFMNEDFSGAVSSSEYAIAIDPKDPESLLSKANCLYNLQNYEEALDYFQRYSEQADEDEFGYLYQGTCLINLGRYQEAVSILKKALDTAPPDSQYLPEIYQELAFGYSELGKTGNALHYLDQTQSLDCDHANMEIIKGHILLANKQPEEASEAFRVALKLSDNSPRTMLRIIVSLYDNQYTQTSYTFLKHLLADMDEDWNEGFSYMALCCRDLGKEKEFLHYLRLASEKNPKEAKTVLSGLFPAGLDPKEYYHYILNRLNKT